MTGGRAIVGGRQGVLQEYDIQCTLPLAIEKVKQQFSDFLFYFCRCSEIIYWVPTSNVELIYPRCMCVYAFHYYYTTIAIHIACLPWTLIYNAGLLGGSVVPTEATTFARVHIHYARPLVAGS